MAGTPSMTTDKKKEYHSSKPGALIVGQYLKDLLVVDHYSTRHYNSWTKLEERTDCGSLLNLVLQ